MRNLSMPGVTVLLSAYFLAACGGAAATSKTRTTGASEEVGSSSDTGPVTEGDRRGGSGEKLVAQAAGCWFGGLWADAEGDLESKGTRKAHSEDRCHALTAVATGSDSEGAYVQMRAIEPDSVDAVAARVASAASSDPIDDGRKANLDKLVRALAAAEKESLEARRGADRVRKDLGVQRANDNLGTDEVAALPALRATAKLEALMNLDAGDLSADARSYALLAGLDRVQMTRDIPKNLKLYAVEGAVKLVFDVVPPPLPTDAQTPLPDGQWLAYLTEVAKAAGHPVDPSIRDLKDRETMAWGGMLAGFADKFAAAAATAPKTAGIDRIDARVSRRLEDAYEADKKGVTMHEGALDTATRP